MGTLIRFDDPSIRPVLPVLLKDRTMKRNIIWATGSYAALGEYYRDSGQITAIALQRMGKDSIQPRILKAQEEQLQRTRKHGEVQTPASYHPPWAKAGLKMWIAWTTSRFIPMVD